MMMKRFSLGILTAFVLLLSLTVTAIAAEADYNYDLGTTEYDGSKLNTSKVDVKLNQVVPDESAQFTVTLKNSSDKETDWYMSNEAIWSFENNQELSGGAYTYILSYNGDEIYNNEVVGGVKPPVNPDDQTDEAHDSTDALGDDYFFLGTLSKGQTAKVTLYVALDGVSQDDDFFESLSEIKLKFAVEEKETNTIIKTGDTTKALPFFIGAGVAGIAIIVLLVVRVRKNRKGGAKA